MRRRRGDRCRRGRTWCCRCRGAGRLQCLPYLLRRQLPDRPVGPAVGWRRRHEHEVGTRRQSVGAVFAAIVRQRAHVASARRHESALAGHPVIRQPQHAHAHAGDRPAARIEHRAGDHAAADDRHRDLRHGLAVFDDDGGAGAIGPRGAVAGAQPGGLERLQFETAGRQPAEAERAVVIGGGRLTWGRAIDVVERDAHAPRGALRVAGREDGPGNRCCPLRGDGVVARGLLCDRGGTGGNCEGEHEAAGADHWALLTRRSSVFAESSAPIESLEARFARASSRTGSCQPSESPGSTATT